MHTYVRPEHRLAPQPTAESSPLWTGGERGELLINRCRGCGHFFHPPAPVCFRCRSVDVAPEPTSGRGVVAAYTINHQTWLPGMPPPYVVAMIELVEDRDVRLTSNVVGVDREDLRVGLEVEVFFERWGEADDSVWIPLFRPSSAVVVQGASA
ncbi:MULTISPECIES: Zn-ribbon domain-containing OB-fold protein [Arsenicicoccus]|uniref:Zn-ribbon domain-containing OB-fold protein n=1 Tax=Arsenicicoccus TaxID=267408 RepID=UPI00257CFF68|nr:MULTISPECIES: OB-fold domain-containing protein [Actinomycetes]